MESGQDPFQANIRNLRFLFTKMITIDRNPYKTVTFCHLEEATGKEEALILQTAKTKGGYHGTIIECM